MPFTTTEFSLTRRTDGLYTLEDPLEYEDPKTGQAWTVDVGNITDFASVPRIVRWLVPKDGDYTPAAILHDWFCSQAIRNGEISAREADRVFRQAMACLGVPPVRRWMMWTAVRQAALFSPIRSEGILPDIPAMLAITILAAPVVIPVTLVVSGGLLVDKLVNLFVK